MTRLMTTVAATALLALPAFAQAPSTSSAPPASAQGSTDRDVGAIEPAAGGKRKSAQRADPERARIADLNRQQLQQIEAQQRR